jgi:hypothetical protein
MPATDLRELVGVELTVGQLIDIRAAVRYSLTHYLGNRRRFLDKHPAEDYPSRWEGKIDRLAIVLARIDALLGEPEAGDE